MLRRIRDLSVGTQFLLLFVAVGGVLVLSAWYCMYLVVGIALEDVPAHERSTIVTIVRWMVSIVVLVTTCSLAGAAALVRRSLLHSLDGIEQASAAIARGEFSHRIGSGRRDELGRLARTIDRTAARLEVLDRSREELVARVSHELRTPLTIIRCQAYSLSVALDEERHRERIQLVEHEIDRLTAMLDDLLLASTLRARPLQLARQHVLVGELAAGVGDRFTDRARSEGRAVRIVADEPEAVVDVDRGRIEQVLANLVGNALAHAPAGSCVDVTLARSRTGVRIAVANDGPTIPPDQLERLFEPFVQGDRATGSVGLGLSIVRDLVAAHGSTVSVVSHGDRTEFSFELPLLATDAASPTSARPAPAERHRRAAQRTTRVGRAVGADA